MVSGCVFCSGGQRFHFMLAPENSARLSFPWNHRYCFLTKQPPFEAFIEHSHGITTRRRLLDGNEVVGLDCFFEPALGLLGIAELIMHEGQLIVLGHFPRGWKILFLQTGTVLVGSKRGVILTRA